MPLQVTGLLAKHWLNYCLFEHVLSNTWHSNQMICSYRYIHMYSKQSQTKFNLVFFLVSDSGRFNAGLLPTEGGELAKLLFCDRVSPCVCVGTYWSSVYVSYFSSDRPWLQLPCCQCHVSQSGYITSYTIHMTTPGSLSFGNTVSLRLGFPRLISLAASLSSPSKTI